MRATGDSAEILSTSKGQRGILIQESGRKRASTWFVVACAPGCMWWWGVYYVLLVLLLLLLGLWRLLACHGVGIDLVRSRLVCRCHCRPWDRDRRCLRPRELF